MIERPEVLHKLAVDLRDYQRAVCKIIYELAYLWLGDAYLDDPIALQLRNTILNGVEEKFAAKSKLTALPHLTSYGQTSPTLTLPLLREWDREFQLWSVFSI